MARISMVGAAASGLAVAGIEQRPAPGKTIFNPVPMRDRFLSITPAEINDFFPKEARKVDQAFLHPFANAAQIMDLLHQFLELFDSLRNPLVALKFVHEISALRV